MRNAAIPAIATVHGQLFCADHRLFTLNLPTLVFFYR